MGAKQVMRVEKLKGQGAIASLAGHCARTRPCHLEHPELSHLNGLAGARTPAEAVDRWKARLPDRYRKDAVTGISVVVSASPEAKDLPGWDWNRYLADGLAWAVRTFGGKQNLIQAAIHWDEGTPHLHVLMVPRLGDRLCANHWLDGSQKLHELQNGFHEEVGEPWGLERGEIGSTRRHVAPRVWRARQETAQLLEPSQRPLGAPETGSERISRG